MLWSTQIIPNDSSEEERRKAPMEIHKYAHTENFFFLLTQLIKDI